MIRVSLDKRTIIKSLSTGLIVAAFVLFVIAFFYFDRQNQISDIIRTCGPFGVILVVLLMAGVCLTPMPSEGLVIMYLKIYGVYLGIFLAWFGATLSALVIFIVVRLYGQGLIQKYFSADHIKTVDRWICGKGATGLLVARLLPLPAFAVNYISAAMPSMKLWTYLWTAALTIIPYYIGTALVFLGVANETRQWFVLGVVALVAFWCAGYYLKKKGH